MTIITLSNGKRVGNFSSPHPFTFTDGSILPAVSDEESERLKVVFKEEPIGDKGDVKLSFALSEAIMKEMAVWIYQEIHSNIDIVFCPLPMMTALHDLFECEDIRLGPFRAVRIEDRIKKLVSIDKQCI